MSESDTKSSDQAPEEQEKQANNDMPNMSACMDQFAKTFEASARRWELIVYPSLIAFIILAAYGFFLIYNLTNDVGRITGQMDVIATSMVKVSENMNTVSQNVEQMSGTMTGMAIDLGKQEKSLNKMVNQMNKMNQSMIDMSVTMYYMRQDMSTMGYSVNSASRPMRFMNNFFPW